MEKEPQMVQWPALKNIGRRAALLATCEGCKCKFVEQWTIYGSYVRHDLLGLSYNLALFLEHLGKIHDGIIPIVRTGGYYASGGDE